MKQGPWVKAGVALIVAALVASLVASLAALGGSPSAAPSSSIPSAGPSLADLDELAADLSSGNDDRVAGALADIPVEAKERAIKALGSLEAVEFDASTVRFDAPTGAALVDARLVASDGSEQEERVVLVQRSGRWLVFSTLQQPGATPLDTPR
jgi:hypothetical protein